MRVPTTGQPLYERRIVREGKQLTQRMLDGYSVTANGRFVRGNEPSRGLLSLLLTFGPAQTLTGRFRRTARSQK